MPPSSVAARSLALALIGVGAASFAAHGQNVIAFNPYSGTGLPGGPIPQYRVQPASPTVDTVVPGPTTGPAFNPWSLRGQTTVATPSSGGASGVPYAGSAMAAPATPSGRASDPGIYLLLPPPSGPITSRIVAVPELTTSRKSRDVQKASAAYVAPSPKTARAAAVAPQAAPAPTPAPVAKAAPKTEAPVVAKPAPKPAASPAMAAAPARPAPTPVPPAATPVPAPPPIAAMPVTPTPPAATPSPPAATVAPPSEATPAPKPAALPAAIVPAPAPAPSVATPAPQPPAAPEQKMAALAPQPSAPTRVPVAITLAFPPRSAELSDASKAELDGLVKNIADRNLRQVELRAFAGNSEPDSRKVSLARALNIRTYLIDKGVKSKIEIGTFSSSDGNERVDILVPNT